MAPVSTPRGRITSLRMLITYPDASVKDQTWGPTFVAQTRALVINDNFMNRTDRERLGAHVDWRRNPCLLRFCWDRVAPEPICEQGVANGGRLRRRLFSRHRHERGTPSRLEVTVSHDSDPPMIIAFDDRWLEQTAAILFLPRELSAAQMRHCFPIDDWRRNPVLIRVGKDGIGEGVAPSTPTQPADRTSVIEENLCGYGLVIRRVTA